MATQRDVTVRVNIQPGATGQVGADARRQLEELKKVQQELAQANAGAAPPALASDRTRQLRELHRATAGMRPGGVGQDEWSQALAQIQQEKMRADAQARQQQVLAQARIATNGGFIPAGAVRTVGGSAGPGFGGVMGVAQGALGAAGQLASGNAMGALESVTGMLGGLAGPIGGVAAAIGLVIPAAKLAVSGFQALGIGLEKIRPPLSELLGMLGRSQADLDRQRQSGRADASDVFRNLSPVAARRLAEAGRVGDSGAVGEIASSEAAAARADIARLEAANPAVARAEMTEYLTGLMNSYRESGATGGRLVNLQERARAMAIAQRGGGTLSPEIANLDVRTLTPDRIQELAQSITQPLVSARARLETATNIGRNGAPSLNPGAPDLSQLPGLFQSRQDDVLDIHSRLQVEAVRDERQQAQFDRQVRLWEQIRDRLPQPGQWPVPPVPAVG